MRFCGANVWLYRRTLGYGAKALSTTEAPSYDLHVTRPVWQPFNEPATLIVDQLAEMFDYPDTGPKADKYRAVLASLLRATQSVLTSQNRKKPQYLGIQRRASAWSLFPIVGRDISKKVISDYLDYLGAKKVEGSGDSGLDKDQFGRWRTDPKMSMYVIDPSSCPDNLSNAKFIQVGLPTVKVNVSESRQQKRYRELQNRSKPSLNRKQMLQVSEEALTASESRIQKLNAHWRKHPIVMSNGHAADCAMRVFHDGRFDAGGRLYGAWTGLDKDTKRLHCTIDNEPICEIDIRASQPTLLSCLLGDKLTNVSENQTWWDVYVELTNLTFYDDEAWDQYLAEFEAGASHSIDPVKRTRTIAKSVVMQLIGLGNANKISPTKELREETGVTQEEWYFFATKLRQAIPALERLEPRYNQTGELSGYMNGAGFLSYHESEITLLTLEKLHSINITAYPVHDCIIVKLSDVRVASQTYRETIRQYCKAMSGLDALVPLKCEVADGVPTDGLPKGDDLRGQYLN